MRDSIISASPARKKRPLRNRPGPVDGTLDNPARRNPPDRRPRRIFLRVGVTWPQAPMARPRTGRLPGEIPAAQPPGPVRGELLFHQIPYKLCSPSSEKSPIRHSGPAFSSLRPRRPSCPTPGIRTKIEICCPQEVRTICRPPTKTVPSPLRIEAA